MVRIDRVSAVLLGPNTLLPMATMVVGRLPAVAVITQSHLMVVVELVAIVALVDPTVCRAAAEEEAMVE